MNARSIYVLLVPLLLNADNILLEPIEVNAQEEQEQSSAAFADDNVFQKEGYLQSAPMQKQISGARAMEVAGSNGDPLKSLQTFAGVVSTTNDNGAEIYIHGSKPRETKFTLNHLPVGYLFHLGGLYSVIAPEMTGQIDAYLGGFDVSYGAMGAVVDITPKYPMGSGHGRLHIGMYDADFAYDAKLGEHTNLFISGRRSYFDLIADKVLDELDKDKDDPRKKTTFTLFPQFYDAQIILTHQLEANILSLEMLMAHDKMKLNDTFNVEKDPVATGKINADYRFHTIGARWVYVGDDVLSNTLLYRLYTKSNALFFDSDYFVDTEHEEYGLFHETVWSLDRHTVSVGTELKTINSPTKVHSSPPSTTDYDGPVTGQKVIDIDKTFRAQEYIVFAQDIWNIMENSYLRYGLRAWKTDFQNFGSGIDPRIAYVYEFSDDLSISMAVGRYSQRPSDFMVVKGFGNPKIKTQESAMHYALSIQKRLADHASLTLEPYVKKFTNLAIADDARNYKAVGKGKAYGIDITYQKQIDNFNIMAAYTYVHATRELNTDTNRQYRFEGDIPHTLQISTNYHFLENWRVSAYLKYASGAPYTPITGTKPYTYKGKNYVKPIYGTPYSSRLDATYDLDIQIGKTYKYANNQSLEVSLELLNINALFKKNVEGIKYNDRYEKDGVYAQMGFLPAFHVTYKF